MSPKKFQYRFCAACGKKFLLKAQIKSRETRMSCSNTCRNKIIWANRRRWTEKETELLKDFAETMPLLQLVRAFNQQLTILGLPKRTRFSIRTRLQKLCLITISEPTRPYLCAYAVFCLKKKKSPERVIDRIYIKPLTPSKTPPAIIIISIVQDNQYKTYSV